MRRHALQTLCNKVENPLDGIFYGFIVVNLLCGVDEGKFYCTGFARCGENRFVEAISLPHTATQKIATIGTFVEFLWCGEQYACRKVGLGLGIDYVSNRIDKSPATAAEQSPYCTE